MASRTRSTALSRSARRANRNSSQSRRARASPSARMRARVSRMSKALSPWKWAISRVPAKKASSPVKRERRSSTPRSPRIRPVSSAHRPIRIGWHGPQHARHPRTDSYSAAPSPRVLGAPVAAGRRVLGGAHAGVRAAAAGPVLGGRGARVPRARNGVAKVWAASGKPRFSRPRRSRASMNVRADVKRLRLP